MKRIIVGNWKMNLGPTEASLLVHRLDEKLEATKYTEVVICPPFVDLFPLAKDLNRKKLKLGAQNIHYMDEGAFTGEISAPMLKGLADYVIVGHSERRAMGETDKDIARKVAAAIRNNLIPVLCLGESLSERHHGLSTKVVTDQLTADLADVTASDVANMVIAYEPVWAIGAGVPATPDEVKPCISAIRSTVEELYGEEAIGSLRIIYGGSATHEIVADFLRIPGIDGFLPGGASLNYEKFTAMVKASEDFE
ncbi:MAG TPA: triose-phosphate isomerase [Candidatus Saccharimonadia bacterium]|nr:triose-phosphate isomerase [Candidatus Saccharimonadia bacterium]